MIPKWMNFLRAVSSEGFGRIKYHTTIRRLLDTDPSVRAYLEGETEVLPAFYRDRIRTELGPMYEHLPPGALEHDQNAYLQTVSEDPELAPIPLRSRRAG
jgi:hypothetical protein